MRLLQTGITGFNSSGNVPAANFKRAVYAAAQVADAQVGEVRPANGITRNFYQIDVDFKCGTRKFVVLCNRHVPVVAVADQFDGIKVECFLKAPAEFAVALTDCGFVIGDVGELNRLVTSDDLKVLSPAEQAQAKYWNPERIGDIVFNWWD